jgi:hypothetical protein
MAQSGCFSTQLELQFSRGVADYKDRSGNDHSTDIIQECPCQISEIAALQMTRSRQEMVKGERYKGQSIKRPKVEVKQLQ